MTGDICGNRGNREEGGFTLLEVVLALSILVMLLGVLFSAIRLGIRSWEKGESAMEDMAARRYISARISRDIGSMYPYIRNDGENAEYLFRGSSVSLGFVTAAGRYGDWLPWGGARWVNYSAGDRGLTVGEKTVPLYDMENADEAHTVVLSPEVKYIGFEYMGPDGWEKSWDANDKKMLPSAIRSSVTFRDGRAPLTVIVNIGVTQPEKAN